METTVPYQPGFLLGRAVDMKYLKPGDMLIGEEVSTESSKFNRTTHKFSFVTTLKDVCDVLDVPPEYALKVKNDVVKHETLDVCLKGVGQEDSFTLIFRSCFLQQKQYYRPDIAVPVPAKPSQGQTETGEGPTVESLIAEAVDDTESDASTYARSNATPRMWTHWVKAVDYGNELVAVMRIFTDDPDKLTKVSKLKVKMETCLQPGGGDLNKIKFGELKKTASYIDKKLSSKEYGHVYLDVEYGCFQELNKYPGSVVGMVKTIEKFMNECAGWEQSDQHSSKCKTDARVMMCITGTDKEENIQQLRLFKSPQGEGARCKSPSSTEKFHGEYDSHNEDEDADSFVVLEHVSEYFYTLRVTLQSFEKGSGRGLTFSQYSEGSYKVFERLYKALHSCKEAADRMQTFLSNKRMFSEKRLEEDKKVLNQAKLMHISVNEAVNNLDFVCIPTEETLGHIFSSRPLETVQMYIEKVESKLPPGYDLDLLLVGKTGHGKSSTGNSILGRDAFATSSGGRSVTGRANMAWSKIDDRIVKVVDTPGVYDTGSDTDASTIDQAIQSVSGAIANCPRGFHALLLIMRFGIRFTKEERKAIGLLKSVMGENIVKSHCICVFTHGDNFKKDMAKRGEKSFETWCKNEDGFLGDLFKECNYRCILFDNDATDVKVKKTQLIRLVDMVDSLADRGTRYTNDIFEIALQNRIAAEEQMPQLNEDLMRDIQLFLNGLNTYEQGKCGDRLTELKEGVDNLSNRISMVNDGQLGPLAETVSALAATIQTKMDDKANRQATGKPESPVAVGGAMPGDGADTDCTVAKRADSLSSNRDIEIQLANLKNYSGDAIKQVQTVMSGGLEEEVKKRSCFPGSSAVILESGRDIKLEKLQIGDRVLVRDTAGHLVYDTVYMFGHRDFEAEREFLVLNTAMQKVFVTKDHFVYCTRGGKELCIAAANVSIGDCLLITSTGGLVPQPVENITYQSMRGLFAPFTHSGTVVVDNALMSCYVDVLQPGTCHALLWPVRQLSRLSPRALAFINGSSTQHPVPRLAKAAMKLM